MVGLIRMGVVACLLVVGCAHRPAPAGPAAPAAAPNLEKKHRFAVDFTAIKRQVRARWSPGQAMHDADPDGKKYGLESRHTLLRVQLDADGNLKRLFIEPPSGVDLLDLMAVKAFQEPAPFPGAPAELVDDGKVTF